MKITKDDHVTIIKLTPSELTSLQDDLIKNKRGIVSKEILKREFYAVNHYNPKLQGKPKRHNAK